MSRSFSLVPVTVVVPVFEDAFGFEHARVVQCAAALVRQAMEDQAASMADLPDYDRTRNLDVPVKVTA